ncbi:hypothetical protein HPB47_010092, partial [Ixodes persulcatus]
AAVDVRQRRSGAPEVCSQQKQGFDSPKLSAPGKRLKCYCDSGIGTVLRSQLYIAQCEDPGGSKSAGSDALVQKLMEFEGDTNLEAKQRIKCRDLYLRTHFFQITRVVNDKLECVRTGLGGPSLDQLG